MLTQFDKAFESRIRLSIMAALAVNESLDFPRLKELLQTTDGNLSSHLKSLLEVGYIVSTKQFLGLKPNTSYQITPVGKAAFEGHLAALEQLIQSVKN